MQMVKATEKLRQQWRNQRAQMIEEREYTQSGRRRSTEDIAIVDHDIATMDTLLALPLGTKFNGMQISAQVMEARTAQNPSPGTDAG